MARMPEVSLVAAKSEGADLLMGIAFALNFLIFALEVALFGFHIEIGDDLATAVSPWMGPAAVFYLGFQVGAAIVTQNITRGAALKDVLVSLVIVGYFGATLIFGKIVEIDAFFPWEWNYKVDLFTTDFIRNFGTASVFELLLVLSFYFRFFQQQTEVSGSPS